VEERRRAEDRSPKDSDFIDTWKKRERRETRGSEIDRGIDS
jgi:hypothetical protein